MATKKEAAAFIESLVEAVAVRHGATLVDVKIKVGGKAVDSKVAVDGPFDLDGARGILLAAFRKYKDTLTSFMPGAGNGAAALEAAKELAAE